MKTQTIMRNHCKQCAFVLLTIISMTFFIGCQEDDVEISTHSNQKNSIKNFVDAKEIPALKGFVATKMSGLPQKSSGSSTMVETPFGFIPLDEVMEVIDLDGNTNYTFGIFPKTPTPNTFYNLIVNPSSDAKEPVSYVLEYTMDDDFSEPLFFGIKQMDQFKGSVKKYSLDTFLDKNITKSADLPCPCTYLGNTGSGFGSGSGDSGTQNNNTGSSTGGSSTDGSSTDGSSGGSFNGGGGSCSIHQIVECSDRYLSPRFFGSGRNCRVTAVVVNCYADKSTIIKSSNCRANDNGDCPRSNGEFGVVSFHLVTYLGLTQQNASWVLYTANQDLAQTMADFLWTFKDNPTALVLAKETAISISANFSNNQITKSQAIATLENSNTYESIFLRADITSAENTGLISTETAYKLFELLNTNLTDEIIILVGELLEDKKSNTITNTQLNSFLERPYVVFGPKVPINNMREFLSVFNRNLPAKITFYVDQPLPGQAVPNDGLDVGHSFISINQNGKIKTFGFYPKGDKTTPFGPSDVGIFGNNSGAQYNVSISQDISAQKLREIIDLTSFNYSMYDLNTSNCTDYIIEVSEITGLNLPQAHSDWGLGGGSNPGAMGEYIRSLPGANTTPGSAL